MCSFAFALFAAVAVHTNAFVRDGVTYVRRGGMTADDSVVTNVDVDAQYGSEKFASAVARVSPPVELPSKWALENVTNAQGNAVVAADVGAVSITGDVHSITGVKYVDGFELRTESNVAFGDAYDMLIAGGGTENALQISLRDVERGVEYHTAYIMPDEINTETRDTISGMYKGARMGATGDVFVWYGDSMADYQDMGIVYHPHGWDETQPAYFLQFPETQGTLAVESWQSLSRSLADANTNTNADRECISTNLCKLVSPAITNAVIHARDRFYDAELDVTWKRTVSGGRIFYDIEAVGDSTED